MEWGMHIKYHWFLEEQSIKIEDNWWFYNNHRLYNVNECIYFYLFETFNEPLEYY